MLPCQGFTHHTGSCSRTEAAGQVYCCSLLLLLVQLQMAEREVADIQIKMVLKHINIPVITVSDMEWHHVEELNSSYCQRSLSSLSHPGWSRPAAGSRYSFPSSPATLGRKFHVVTTNQSLRNFPNQNNNIALPPPLVG